MCVRWGAAAGRARRWAGYLGRVACARARAEAEAERRQVKTHARRDFRFAVGATSVRDYSPLARLCGMRVQGEEVSMRGGAERDVTDGEADVTCGYLY